MLDKEKILIIGSASQILGIKIANKLGIECIDTEFKTFPDGENYLRINVEDETILKGKEEITNIVEQIYFDMDDWDI